MAAVGPVANCALSCVGQQGAKVKGGSSFFFFLLYKKKEKKKEAFVSTSAKNALKHTQSTS